MYLLETVDFSSNQLSGTIPRSISCLTFLNHLDLSNNNLTGEIPSSTQLQGFDASCFTGNQLCGPPISKKCIETSPTPVDENGRGKKENEDEVEWGFYISMLLGSAVSFWSVIGPLFINRR